MDKRELISAVSSPHPWGCFPVRQSAPKPQGVFPTPVGVFLKEQEIQNLFAGLPHTRGGVSRHKPGTAQGSPSSPHPWGCFLAVRYGLGKRAVFPTPVGVFPAVLTSPLLAASLPHTRGGVSKGRATNGKQAVSSPHPWGCFLSSVATVMLAMGLPHTRGGVSPKTGERIFIPASSPHPWGCFLCKRDAQLFIKVFPTPVGVFLLVLHQKTMEFRLPHTRGGVSPTACR